MKMRRRHRLTGLLLVVVVIASLGLPAFAAAASVVAHATHTAAVMAAAEAEGGSLEAAASKASQIGRTVAMSLIALGLATAAIVLAFKRDFKEAVGVFAVGLVAVLLATPAGLTLLRDTANTLVGGR
jgi:hypothetical protein